MSTDTITPTERMNSLTQKPGGHKFTWKLAQSGFSVDEKIRRVVAYVNNQVEVLPLARFGNDPDFRDKWAKDQIEVRVAQIMRNIKIEKVEA